MKTLLLIAASVLALMPLSKAAEKEESVSLHLQVLTEADQKPVPNAHVVIRFVKGKKFFKQKRTAWEAKTNGNGSLVLDGIPPGSVKIQVIAKGYQTYGDEQELTQPDETVTILLKTPSGQVSSY
jgi:uncharacterized GH25 family protein